MPAALNRFEWDCLFESYFMPGSGQRDKNWLNSVNAKQRCFIHPSIHSHPLSPGSGRGGNRPSRLTQTSLSPATFSSLFWGSRGVPKDIVPPACPGSSLGSPPSWTCLENLSREASRRHPNQMPEPPQLNPFDAKEYRLDSKLPPDVRAPYPISKAEPGHPTEETNFSRLYSRPCSFGHELRVGM